MIRFEEHEGQLFRMLEEPVPLTTDAKLPCLVRLIQDDSRMGMFNRDTKPNRLSDFYLAARIVNNNIIVDEFMESDYHRFEIIGYPVEEGSKDWALYQMMQGEKVFRVEWECCDMYCQYTNNEIITFRYGISSTINPVEEWIANAKRAGFGWQIYKETKPEPKERPLRNLILRAKEQGMNIRTWYQDLIFTPESLTSYLNNGKFRWWNIGDWELTKREANMPMPEPEPPKEPDYIICKRCGGSKSIANPAVSNTSYTTCPTCNGTGKVEKPILCAKCNDHIIANDGAICEVCASTQESVITELQGDIEELKRRMANAMDSARAAQNCIKIARVDIYMALERIIYILTAPPEDK